MAQPFVAEIRIVPFNFAPTGWAMCDGQTLPISQHTALFSLLGINFGGNGTSNFLLPNLQGRVAMDYGNGSGLTPRNIGESGGDPTITLAANQLAGHNHSLIGDTSQATSTAPSGKVLAVAPHNPPAPAIDVYKAGTVKSPISMDNLIEASGGNLPHNNLQPYLVMNYIIALAGIFPARD